MQAKLINQAGQQRSFVIVLDSDDEVMACLKRFAEQNNVAAAQLSAIGAFQSAVLGYFDWQTKQYRRNSVSEQVEVAAFIGDIARGPDDRPSLHVHCVLGCRDGRALAGHLLEGRVRPTLEIVLTDSPAYLRKRHDPESGLALIDLSASSGHRS
jgi:predicted DNA-binding protein with PD1-like motif